MTLAERRDPPLYAVGALSRVLDDIARDHPTAWLLVLFDLLDKARLCEPSHELNFLVRAAIASAPNDDARSAALTQIDRFERSLRSQLRVGPPVERDADRLEVLVVVPKRIERLAFDATFDLKAELVPRAFDSHVRFRRFDLEGATAGRAVCTVVCLQEAGNLLAANVVRDAVSAFGRPDLAVLCGMAMSTDTDLGPGHVVVAEAVHDYAPRRVTDTGYESRFRHPSVPRWLLQDLRQHVDVGRELYAQRLAQACARGRLQADVDVQDPPDPPKVKVGVVLSGEELVEDGSGPERAAIHDRIMALEMEGAGFADACEHVGVPWFVVRGLADAGEPKRSKAWQWTAAAAAASFTHSFVMKGWRPSEATALNPDRAGGRVM
jgi:nucleoside phosphorylase